MPLRLASALRLVTALALLAALPALARAAPRGRPHRDVSAAQEQDCAICHRTATPKVTAAWEASPHGVALVKCLVCHGSTGKDFRARPAADGCSGCHATQVETLAHRAPRAPSDCYACHSPHALSPNPHRDERRPSRMRLGRSEGGDRGGARSPHRRWRGPSVPPSLARTPCAP